MGGCAGSPALRAADFRRRRALGRARRGEQRGDHQPEGVQRVRLARRRWRQRAVSVVLVEQVHAARERASEAVTARAGAARGGPPGSASEMQRSAKAIADVSPSLASAPRRLALHVPPVSFVSTSGAAMREGRVAREHVLHRARQPVGRRRSSSSPRGSVRRLFSPNATGAFFSSALSPPPSPSAASARERRRAPRASPRCARAGSVSKRACAFARPRPFDLFRRQTRNPPGCRGRCPRARRRPTPLSTAPRPAPPPFVVAAPPATSRVVARRQPRAASAAAAATRRGSPAVLRLTWAAECARRQDKVLAPLLRAASASATDHLHKRRPPRPAVVRGLGARLWSSPARVRRGGSAHVVARPRPRRMPAPALRRRRRDRSARSPPNVEARLEDAAASPRASGRRARDADGRRELRPPRRGAAASRDTPTMRMRTRPPTRALVAHLHRVRRQTRGARRSRRRRLGRAPPAGLGTRARFAMPHDLGELRSGAPADRDGREGGGSGKSRRRPLRRRCRARPCRLIELFYRRTVRVPPGRWYSTV